jgi:hypothetical protein
VSRALSWARLSFSLHRWEVLGSAAGVVALGSAMLWFAWQLRTLAATEPGCPDPTSFVPGCEQLATRFVDLYDWGTNLLLLSWGAPFGMGLLLGVPLVAREVEHRTAAIAWTLSRSRAAWLARRLAFLALVLIGLLSVVAVASEVLASALMPTAHLDRDFTWHGQRGGLIVARGLLALGLGALVGALVGRVLPGLLAAAFASVLAFTGFSLGMDRWLEADSQVLPALNGSFGTDRDGALSLGSLIELEGGELMSWSDAYEQGRFENVVEDMDGRLYDSPDGYIRPDDFIGWGRERIIPGHRYPEIVLRESAVAGGAALLLGLGAAGAVSRRRPG